MFDPNELVDNNFLPMTHRNAKKITSNNSKQQHIWTRYNLCMITVVDRYLVANLPDPGQQGDVADLDGGDVLGVGVLLDEV